MSENTSTLGRTRVKICGITRQQDLDAAVRAGADAIGLVFYAPSKRSVNIEQAVNLRKTVPAFVDVTALFVNADQETVQEVIERVQPDILQFHGDETPAYCEGFHRRYMKAFRVGGPDLNTAQSVIQACRQYPSASAWLFDSHSPGYGGSGLTFDAGLLQEVRQATDSRPLVLAGGLTSATVTRAVQRLQPFAVDVSSGVEGSPGIKSAVKIQAFIQAVAAAHA